MRFGRRQVLAEVSLSLCSGEMLVVVGPNGAGKSTLLRALVGVLPVDDGFVLVGGRRLEGMSRREIARHVSYLPQECASSFSLSVREVVRLGRFAQLGAFRSFTRDDIEAVEEAMYRADVLSFAGRTLPTLSGGERRRVFIARAIAQRARVLVLDEPTSSLDIGHACGLLEMLDGLVREGIAVVLSLHELTLALRGPQRLLLLDTGRIAGSGAPEEVLTGAAAWRAFGIQLVSVGEPAAIVPGTGLS